MQGKDCIIQVYVTKCDTLAKLHKAFGKFAALFLWAILECSLDSLLHHQDVNWRSHMNKLLYLEEAMDI